MNRLNNIVEYVLYHKCAAAEEDSLHQTYDYIPDASYAEIADRMGC